MSDPVPSESPKTCPKCGSELSASDTNGLCPACLMAEVMQPTQSDAKSKCPAVLTPEELAPLFPQYEIQRILGRGGMGAVYLARQISLNRLVAIKVLPADLLLDDGGPLNFAERFKNEAQAMAQLSHPGIVAVYDFGQTSSGLLYIVMEYIEGTDVQQMVAQQGRLRSAHAMAVTAHVCDALAYAHSRGIIHRDIKPSNIMVSSEGVVKVADFGLAKMSHSSQTTGITQSGVAMGTLHFMAPEALTLGVAVDQRADIYAVGVMLYQMLTGKLPQGLFEMPSLQVPGLDPRYDRIVAKALREDRNVRYQQASELRHDLDAILTQPVVKVEPPEEKKTPAAVPPPASKSPFRPPPPKVIVRTEKKGSPMLWAALIAMGGVGAWLYLRTSNDGPGASLALRDKTAPIAGAVANDKENVNLAQSPKVSPGGAAQWVSMPWAAALDQVQSKGVNLSDDSYRWVEIRHTTVDLKKLGRHKGVAVRLRVRWLPDTKHAQIYLVGTNGNVGLFIYRDSLSVSTRTDNKLRRLASHQLRRPFSSGDEIEVIIASFGSHFVAQVGDVFLDGGKADDVRGDLNIGLGSFLTNPDNPTAVEFSDLAYAALDEEANPWAWLAASMRIPGAMLDDERSRRGMSLPVSAVSLTATTNGVSDLLSLVDLKRDALVGKWKSSAEGVELEPGNYPQARLDLPFTPPEEYDFEIEFTPTIERFENVFQCFTADGRAVRWVIQGQPRWATPSYAFQPLDGKEVEASEANILLPKHLKKGQRYQSVVRVRKGSLQALLDGEVIISWTGDMRRFPERWPPPWETAKPFGIGARDGGVIFHRAVIREIVPANAPTVAPVQASANFDSAITEPPNTTKRTTDLMPLADVTKDALAGTLTRDSGGALRIEPLNANLAARFQFPHPTEAAEFDYLIEFSVLADAKPDQDGFCMKFPAKGNSISWAMQLFPASSSQWYGFLALDGKEAAQSPPEVNKPGGMLARGVRHQAVVKVRRDSLTAMLNGEELVHWKGDIGRFKPALNERAIPLRDPRFLGVTAGIGGVIIHKATITEFLPQAQTPPSVPTGPSAWTDTKGRSITATFKAIASGNVLLDIAGKVTPVPLNTLSAESQKLARDLAKNADFMRTTTSDPQKMVQKRSQPQVPPINKSGWRSLLTEHPDAFSKTPIQDLGDGWRTIQLGAKALPLLEASNAAIRIRAKDALNLIVRWSATAPRGSHGFKASVLPSAEEARLSGGIIMDVTGDKIWGFKSIRPSTLGFTKDVEYELELRAYGDQVTILVNGEVKYETSKVNLPGEWLALYNVNGPCRFKDLEWMPLDAKGRALIR